MFLYHGTNRARAQKILREGFIKTGGMGAPSNWKHTVESHPNAVYLTVAYAGYFAFTATKKKAKACVLEIDSDKLPGRLGADEDAIEQARRMADDTPKDWDMKKRTQYYQQYIFNVEYTKSLQTLGNCTHEGPIPVSAITRIIEIDYDAMARMVVRGMDPQISVLNYRFMGGYYRAHTAWLAGRDPDPADMPQRVKWPSLDPTEPPVERWYPAHWPPLDDRTGITIIDLTNP